MSRRFVGCLFLAIAMMTVGSSVIASKIIAGEIQPFLATFFRYAIAFPVFFIIFLAISGPLPKLSRNDWFLLILQAGAGSVGYTTLLISGLSYLSAADAGVIIGTLPAVSALFSVLILGERPNRRLWLSVGCATLGLLIVTWSDTGPRSLIGILFVLGAVVCESTFILLGKRMESPLPPLPQSMMMAGLGLLIALPFAVFELPSDGIMAISASSDAIGAVVFYALVPTVAGFLLWYAGAARVTGTEAAVFTAVAPITAVLFSAVWLGENITMMQVAGMIAVVTAILLLALPSSSKTKNKAHS